MTSCPVDVSRSGHYCYSDVKPPWKAWPRSPVTNVAFSPDGRHLCSLVYVKHSRRPEPEYAYWKVTVWDAQTGRKVWSFNDEGNFSPDTFRFGLAVTPDGRLLAAGWVFHFETGKRAPEQSYYQSTQSQLKMANLACTPDGRWLVGEEKDSLCCFDWRGKGMGPVCQGASVRDILCTAISADGKLVAGGGLDRAVRIWNAQTGELLQTLKGHRGCVRSVGFSPDGQRVVSGGGEYNGYPGFLGRMRGRDNIGEVKVWDANTGQELLSLKGHSPTVYCVAFSPDGTHIISGSEDGTLKAWDTPREAAPLTLTGDEGPVGFVQHTPDGSRFVSGGIAGRGGSVKVWDAATGSLLFKLPGMNERSALLEAAISPDGGRLLCISSGSFSSSITD